MEALNKSFDKHRTNGNLLIPSSCACRTTCDFEGMHRINLFRASLKLNIPMFCAKAWRIFP